MRKGRKEKQDIKRKLDRKREKAIEINEIYKKETEETEERRERKIERDREREKERKRVM